jgi:hypothetical protein
VPARLLRQEAWLPGPAHRGITDALLVNDPTSRTRGRPPRPREDLPSQLHLIHADGGRVAVLPLQQWAATADAIDQLTRLLTGAGIRVRPAPPATPTEAVHPGLGPGPLHRSLTRHDHDTGLTEQDVWAPFIYLAIDVYAFAAVNDPLIRALAIAPFVLQLAAVVWSRLNRRRLDRTVTPAASAGTS